MFAVIYSHDFGTDAWLCESRGQAELTAINEVILTYLFAEVVDSEIQNRILKSIIDGDFVEVIRDYNSFSRENLVLVESKDFTSVVMEHVQQRAREKLKEKESNKE